MRNRRLRFVAHVGKTEGFAFDLSIAAVDHEIVLRAQLPHEFGGVDLSAISYAQRIRRGSLAPVCGAVLGLDYDWGRLLRDLLRDPARPFFTAAFVASKCGFRTPGPDHV